MKITLTLFALFAFCGCARSPRDAWVGSYVGTATVSSRDCATGELFAPAARSVRVEVVPVGADRLGIDGACLIEFGLNGPNDGRTSAGACGSTLDDGTPVNYEHVSGRLELDGDELSFDFSGRASTAEWCSTSDTVFVGLRE